METEAPIATEQARWRQLYLAALFENDRTKMPGRIQEAVAAILDRSRKLFPNGNYPERQQLHSALQALHVLQNCVERGRVGARVA
jgi:hypothetical protein